MSPSESLWKKLLSDFYLFLAILSILAFIKVLILYMYYVLMIENYWTLNKVGCFCFVLVFVSYVAAVSIRKCSRDKNKKETELDSQK
jgi:uncharacterized BrkB/YihY/UPF0761 family membrane protein